MFARAIQTSASRALFAACIWAVSPLPVHAQRGGRPDGVQNYMKGIPDASLKIRFNEQKVIWPVPVLARLAFVSINAYDSQLRSMREYTGIRFSDLLPSGVASAQADEYEIHYGFFHTRRIKSSDLNAESVILVADEGNDHFANRLSRIRFIIASPNESVVIDGVVEVVVKRTPQDRQNFNFNAHIDGKGELMRYRRQLPSVR